MQQQRPFFRFVSIGTLIFVVIWMLHPAPPLPAHRGDLCRLFHQNRQWYWAAEAARKRWGVPVSTQMAIILEESHFRGAARPARYKLFGLIPLGRPTSAEGYAQAINETWHEYLRATHQRSADRYDFSKATDFVGWYVHRIHLGLAIPFDDVFHLYLAYHEGFGNYKHRSYLQQPHLLAIASKVNDQAARYHAQLVRCHKQLPKKHFWNVL